MEALEKFHGVSIISSSLWASVACLYNYLFGDMLILLLQGDFGSKTRQMQIESNTSSMSLRPHIANPSLIQTGFLGKHPLLVLKKSPVEEAITVLWELFR